MVEGLDKIHLHPFLEGVQRNMGKLPHNSTHITRQQNNAWNITGTDKALFPIATGPGTSTLVKVL